MIIYNVTSKIDWSIHELWVQWMKEVHIPEVIATGMFQDSRMMRLLEVDDSEGPTYAIQYFAYSMDDYYLYLERYAPVLREQTMREWGNKFIAFHSLMQTVN